MISIKIENVVYIITNPQYPGYIKIGYASDLKQRLASLNTGALVEFVPYAVYETPMKNGDTEIHDIIKLLNPILRASKFDESKVKLKEFFKIEPEEAFELLEHIANVSGTRHRLYRVDKYFNKIDVKPVAETTMQETSLVADTPATQPSTTCIPDGIYTMKTKIKSLNKIVQGTLEVKDGKFILKAGTDVAPEEIRYEKYKLLFVGLKVKDDILIEDKEVGSVSTAASIVRGGASNGWEHWKNSNGELISIYREGSDST